MHIHTRYKKGLDGMDVWHHAPIKQQPEHFKTLIHQDSLNVLDSRHHTKFRFRVSGCSEQAYSEYFLGGVAGCIFLVTLTSSSDSNTTISSTALQLKLSRVATGYDR